MRIELDAAKDQRNLEKHGVPLSAAVYLEWDDALTWDDTRKEYGEPRQGCGWSIIASMQFR